MAELGGYCAQMKLDTYIQSNGLNYSKFANILGTGDGKTVSRYARGERIPRREVMAAIYMVTDGVVTANDFYDLPSV